KAARSALVAHRMAAGTMPLQAITETSLLPKSADSSRKSAQVPGPVLPMIGLIRVFTVLPTWQSNADGKDSTDGTKRYGFSPVGLPGRSSVARFRAFVSDRPDDLQPHTHVRAGVGAVRRHRHLHMGGRDPGAGALVAL